MITKQISLPQEYQLRPFLWPVVIMGLIIFSFIGVFFLIGKLQENRNVTGQLQDDVKVLSAKKTLLDNINAAQAQQQKDLLINALPDKAAVLMLMQQVRAIAQKNNVEIVQMKASASELKNSTGKSEVTIQVTGPLTGVQQFLSEIQHSLPVVTVGDGRMSAGGNNVDVNVSLQTFAKKLPQSLPPVTTPITAFTNDEQQFITKIKNYEVVVQIGQSTSSATPSASRPNPFSF